MKGAIMASHRTHLGPPACANLRDFACSGSVSLSLPCFGAVGTSPMGPGVNDATKTGNSPVQALGFHPSLRPGNLQLTVPMGAWMGQSFTKT